MREEKKGVLGSTKILVQVLKTIHGHTLKSPQFGLRLVDPEGLSALNRENAAPLFCESRYLKSVWLSGVILQREIAANSTYWKAKVRNNGLEDGEGVPGGKKGGFGINQNPGPGPKNNPWTYT